MYRVSLNHRKKKKKWNGPRKYSHFRPPISRKKYFWYFDHKLGIRFKIISDYKCIKFKPFQEIYIYIYILSGYQTFHT